MVEENGKKGIVTTFPIGVRSNNPKLGLFMIPILADFFRRRNNNLELKVILNSLDSYKDRNEFILPYLTQLERFGISKDDVLVDRDNKDSLGKIVRSLYTNGDLTEQIRNRYLCPCGKFEMLTDIKLNPSARFYSVKENIPHCNLCNSDAKIVYNQPALLMTYPQEVNIGQVIPDHQKKEAIRLYEDIPGHEFLVSRSRNTGILFEGDLSRYNLDVDFLWMNFLSLIGKNKDTFVVGSNHVLWHLCLMNSLYQCSQNGRQDKKECTLITPSYLIDKNDGLTEFINEGYQIDDPNLSRILVLSSISFNAKNSSWNSGILKYSRGRLKGLSREYSPSLDLDNSIFESIKYLRRTNVERALKEKRIIGETYDIRGWLT